MIFLNPLPIYFWLIPIIPIIIFLINRRNFKTIKFSSIKYLVNLKNNEINRLKINNILLLILRTLILLIILIIVMRPSTDKLILSKIDDNKKIINYIFIDDSFSNKYGITNDTNRIDLIDDIVNRISSNYPLKSRLKIATMSKGVIFDDFNSKDLKLWFIDSNTFDYKSMEDFFINKSDIISNVHLISNSNKTFINKSEKLIQGFKSKKYNVYYHYLPEIDNNQYISNVELLNNINGTFYYKVTIGNKSDQTHKLLISGYKNNYNYNNGLVIDKQIPLFSKEIILNPRLNYIDTIGLKLKPEYFSELIFKLEKLEDQSDWIDNRYEDNDYSYVMDIPKKINVSVIYNNQEDKKYLSSILSSFKIITNNLDTNFFNVDYIYSNGINKYSEIIKNKDILIFSGYNIFQNSDLSVINDFLNNQESHLILFPNRDDIKNIGFTFNINDSLIIKNSFINNISNNYDTVQYQGSFEKEYGNFINQKLKLYNYFVHPVNQNTNFKVNRTNSIWSRYKLRKGYFDLFGFIVDNGNNFSASESYFLAPFLYSIIIDDKIDYSKNNRFLNQKFNILNIHSEKSKLIDSDFDSLIFYKNQNPVISTKSTKGLLRNNILTSLYAFNPLENNFNNNYILDTVEKKITNNIINYSKLDYNDDIFATLIDNNEITKYFIYLLLLLLFLEMILSNARPSRSK